MASKTSAKPPPLRTLWCSLLILSNPASKKVKAHQREFRAEWALCAGLARLLPSFDERRFGGQLHNVFPGTGHSFRGNDAGSSD
jgi:hypothetical protein